MVQSPEDERTGLAAALSIRDEGFYYREESILEREVVYATSSGQDQGPGRPGPGSGPG